MSGFFWRFRDRQRPAPAPVAPPEDFPKQPDLVDWPRIHSRHPHWWQVHRIEIHGDEKHLVLIAEVRDEDAAFRVAAQQVSQVRITKFPSKARPYESYRPPLVVITGTVEASHE